MARLTPDEYVNKWGRRLKGATQDIRAGIDRVTIAPGVKAAAQQETMRRKLNESIDDGTWSASVKAVTVDQWKDAAKSKGVDRIAAGVDSALPRQAAMAGKLLAAVDAAKAEADKTPRGTLADNMTRMNTFVQEMAKRKLRRPGGR